MTDAPDTTPATEREPTEYEKWQQAVAKAATEKAQQTRERADAARQRGEAAMARVRGLNANDGTGRCKWCGLVLGTDADGHRTHPYVRECPGPAPEPCALCRQPYAWYPRPAEDTRGGEWWHHCTGKPVGQAKREQLERVQQPGAGDSGAFGYRRGGES